MNRDTTPEERREGSHPSEVAYDQNTDIPGNSVRITSPDYPGYAVSVFLQNGYTYTRPGVVLRTPEGCVSFKDRRFADLYVALMDQYDAASAAAGLGVPQELTADYVLHADVDQKGGDETILVTAGEDSIHVEVVDRAGVDFLFSGPYSLRTPGIDMTSGALILSEVEGDWYLLQFGETEDPFVALYPNGVNRTITVREVERASDASCFGYPKILRTVSYHEISGHIGADAEELEAYRSEIVPLLANAIFVCGFVDGKPVLGNNEDAPSAETFLGLQPFYHAYAELYPGISDESVPLSERIETLKAIVKAEYDSTHVIYTVTSAYGSIRALNLADDHAYHSLLIASLNPDEVWRFEKMDSFPWLEADLTSSGSLSVAPGPGLTAIINPLTERS
ncbi:MAG: hypothetical protein J6U26_06485, partial [Lachnospiraceae bacterium]|nr:hypothetical protein [Lachnospiraceae bacterium]